MNHTFDINIAKKFGVDCAIVLENLHFWINKNKSNRKHFYEDRYWTYNTAKAFEELFPYWSESQIRRILKKLEDYNLIYVGNFNKVSYDQTKWYSLNDSLILRNRQIELTESSIRTDEIVRPIPDINTDINTDINLCGLEKPREDFISDVEDKNHIDFDGLLKLFNTITKKNFRVINPKTKKQFKARIKEGYTKDDIRKAIINCYNSPYHKENPQYLTPEFISRADKLEKYSNFEGSVVELPKDWFHRDLTKDQQLLLSDLDLLNWERNKTKIAIEGGRLLPMIK